MVEAGTLCENSDVVLFAGANVSATSVAEAATNVYIKCAEGILKEKTNYDWVANYASVDTNRKEALRMAAACKAAMLVIQYNMTGSSQREFEKRLDLLTNFYNEAVGVLTGLGAS